MYRGTTPNLYLELETDLDLSIASQIWVTVESSLSVLNKEKKDISVRAGEEPGWQVLVVPLSQKDTLKLTAGKAKIQVRILMPNNKAYSTEVECLDVNQILREGVITGEDTE